MTAVDKATRDLVIAMKRMQGALFEASTNLALGALPSEQQAEFGNLLVELGESVLQHAEGQLGLVIESPGEVGAFGARPDRPDGDVHG